MLAFGLQEIYSISHREGKLAETEVIWQEGWGSEFGGENPENLERLNAKFYMPFGARLARAPKGRKQYQGRIERSHRTDDEEFYIRLLGEINSAAELLRLAQW